MYKVKYYGENKESPVIEFIKKQSPKEKAKISREIYIAFNRSQALKRGEFNGINRS